MAYDDRLIRQKFTITIDDTTVLDKNNLFINSGYTDIRPDFLQFSEIPENLKVFKSANYVDEAVLGRAEPWKAYANSSSTVIQFNAKLVGQGAPADDGFAAGATSYAAGLAAKAGNFFPAAAPFLGVAGNAISLIRDQFEGGGLNEAMMKKVLDEEVHLKVKWLYALTHPQKDEAGRTYPPPAIYLNFGENIKEFRGVIRNIGLTFMAPYTQDLLSFAVDCALTIEEVNKKSKTYNDVRGGKIDFVGEEPLEDPSERGFLERNVLDRARSTFGL